MNDTIPQIDGYPVSLGDVVSFPEIGGCISNGRIKGWSPCGTMLYVAWVGAIKTELCSWCCDIEESKFARLYKPMQDNRWCDAIAWGLARELSS